MDNTTAQAFADFERFLMGQSAPALVGHALATVVRYDIRAIAETVMQKAYTAPPPERAKAILVLRAKVYDIFFYRIVRFRRVYDFFPRFEKAFIEAAPVGDRPAVTELFRRYPWQEIRPIGEMRDPQEFALEVRPQAAVTPEQFNEDLYRSATHQILSADKRFRFTDEAVRENVVQYQAQVNEVFDDFVSLIKDALMRREIMLANVADRDIVYQHQQQFQIEGYLGQLAIWRSRSSTTTSSSTRSRSSGSSGLSPTRATSTSRASTGSSRRATCSVSSGLPNTAAAAPAPFSCAACCRCSRSGEPRRCSTG
ncbi:MAG: hypothetical protein IPF53_18835 [Blastocatellia bacterium]|nr:hypothetical protein [Blastocatellia bacterium]